MTSITNIKDGNIVKIRSIWIFIPTKWYVNLRICPLPPYLHWPTTICRTEEKMQNKTFLRKFK